MIALLAVSVVVLPLAGLFFHLGREWERAQPHADVIAFPVRRSLTVHTRRRRPHRTIRQRAHLRLVNPIFDFESQGGDVA